jgi:transposase-like protein
MSIRQPLCPRCQDDLFVRAEQVISGRRVTQAFYCGRCNDEWQVEHSTHGGERRQTERRRTQRLEDAIAELERKVAAVRLPAKSQRRIVR